MLVHNFRRVVGSFRLMSPQKCAQFAGLKVPTLAPIRIIEDGAVRTVVEALFQYRHSFLCLRYKLPQKGREIEIEARVHWNEKDRLLKLSIPFIETENKILGQVAYGYEELAANGNEAVAQKWALLTSGDIALSIINDRTYGLDFKGGELRLSLLRSPGYAVHPIINRPLLPEDRYSPRHDQGERVYHFWLQGGRFDERLEHIDHEALAHNEKPVALSFFPSGDGKRLLPFVRISDPAVQVSAIKRAEDHEALIFRFFETTGKGRVATLELPFAGVEKEIQLSAFEIRTLRFDLADKKFDEVNLIEEEI
jgi:alpha-mannosidase